MKFQLKPEIGKQTFVIVIAPAAKGVEWSAYIEDDGRLHYVPLRHNLGHGPRNKSVRTWLWYIRRQRFPAVDTLWWDEAEVAANGPLEPKDAIVGDAPVGVTVRVTGLFFIELHPQVQLRQEVERLEAELDQLKADAKIDHDNWVKRWDDRHQGECEP